MENNNPNDKVNKAIQKGGEGLNALKEKGKAFINETKDSMQGDTAAEKGKSLLKNRKFVIVAVVALVVVIGIFAAIFSGKNEFEEVIDTLETGINEKDAGMIADVISDSLEIAVDKKDIAQCIIDHFDGKEVEINVDDYEEVTDECRTYDVEIEADGKTEKYEININREKGKYVMLATGLIADFSQEAINADYDDAIDSIGDAYDDALDDLDDALDDLDY